MATAEEELRAAFDPTNLTSDATQAATPSLLGQLNAAPKRRGRPPGSRNRAKPDYGTIGAGGPQTLVTPGRATRTPPGTPPGDPPKPDPAKVAEAKRAKAEAYTKRILEETNDYIMLTIISLGLPQDLIYQPGKAPAEVQVSNKYTEFGNQIAIKPSQARALAAFAAEAEFLPQGQKVATSVGSGYGPLVIKGFFALGAGMQYVRGLGTIRKQLEPLLKMREAHLNNQAQRDANPNGTVPSPARTGGLA